MTSIFFINSPLNPSGSGDFLLGRLAMIESVSSLVKGLSSQSSSEEAESKEFKSRYIWLKCDVPSLSLKDSQSKLALSSCSNISCPFVFLSKVIVFCLCLIVAFA